MASSVHLVPQADQPTERVELRVRPHRRLPEVQLPDFRLLRVIGTGGMGVVYQAHDVRLDRVVAIKLLHSGGFADPQAEERFRFEAQVVARLRHPSIVQPFQFGESDHVDYLVMEYVDGPNLYAAAGRRPVPARQAAGVVRAVAEAVGFAHRAGVVHRDLKPANVLLAGPDLSAPVRVTDFGMARLLTDHPELSQDGTVSGTPGYMAPEQCRLDGQVGPWTDVYALGVILYELLTGRLPVPDDPVDRYLSLVQTFRPPAFRLVARGVPRDLESVCLKCLAKEPAERYLTADALADDLARFLTGRPVAARPLSGPAILWRTARLHPLSAGLAAACATALVVGAGLAGREARRADAAATRAETAAADAVAARAEEAVARQAADRAAAAARREAERADRQHWAERNARAESDLTREFVLGGLVETLRQNGHTPAATAALRAVGRSIDERFADNPVVRDRLRVIVAQRLHRTLGDPAAAEAPLRAAVNAPPVPGNYNQQIAVFELADLLLLTGRAGEAADLVLARVGRCEAEYGWGEPTSRNLRLVGCRALLEAGRPSEAAWLAARELAGPSPEEQNPHLRPVWLGLLRQAPADPGGAAAGPAAALR